MSGRFLSALSEGCTGALELRALPSRSRAFIALDAPQDVAAFVASHSDENLYFGVATRDGDKGDLDHCVALPALYIDVDFKTIAEAEARERLTRFALTPSAVVRSGGGWHAYWFLKEPVDLAVDAGRAKALLRRLAVSLGGDLAAAEPARILRLPGSVNYKYTPARPVVIDRLHPDHRVNLADFDFLQEEPTATPTPFRAPEQISVGERNATLFREARSLKAKGLAPAAVLAALLEENEAKCQPPLEKSEVTEIYRSAMTQPDRAGFLTAPPDKDRKVTKVAAVRPEAVVCTMQFTALGDLLDEPDEAYSWLVEGRLPSSGLSVFAGKPKAAKSTAARCLALAVARGEPWLGLPTRQGPVLYLGLEEKRAEVRRHFRLLGAHQDDRVRIFTAPAPIGGLHQLRTAMAEYRPSLVIIDPLFRFTRVPDGNDYAVMTTALEPLVTLARETEAHLLLVHHAGKGERGGLDSVLGSTAITGAVDTVLLLRRTDRYRLLSTEQRYGDALDELVVALDPQTHQVSAGPTRAEADARDAEQAILTYLADHADALEEAIDEAVEGRTATKRKALRVLRDAGKVAREGSGKRGDPYRYSVSCSLVPNISGEQENKKLGTLPPARSCDEDSRSGEIEPRSESGRRGNENSAEPEARAYEF